MNKWNADVLSETHIYIHTHTHTYINTYIHTHIHTSISTSFVGRFPHREFFKSVIYFYSN